jgi:signal transduction histidine kinase
MRERAELVGGELELAPAPGQGTVMRLTVPLAGRPAVAPPVGDRPTSEVA